MNDRKKRICVFSGSSKGNRPEYSMAAESLGQLLVKNDIELVYGGGNVGLMGVVADTVMQEGGVVTGVIPEFLEKKEVAHTKISDLHIVDSMHERKALMAELSIGFIALPGGLGTFEELLEVLTWSQLGIHKKPCAVLNVCHYFDHLLQLLDHAVDQQFLKVIHRELILESPDPEILIESILNYEHTSTGKWIKT